MSNRVDNVLLRRAREAAEDNLAMAIKHSDNPKLEDKFMAQAIRSEVMASKLAAKLA